MKKFILPIIAVIIGSAAITGQILPTVDRGLVEIDDLTERAMNAIDNEDYDSALTFIRAQIKKTPKDPDPRCILGVILSLTDKPQQGSIVMDAALKLFDTDDKIGIAKALFLRGILRHNAGDSIGALDDYSEAMAIDPVPYISDYVESRDIAWHPFFRYLPGEVSAADLKVSALFNSGDHDKALELQNRLISEEKDPVRIVGRYNKNMDMHLAAGDTLAALDDLTNALFFAGDADTYSTALSIPDEINDQAVAIMKKLASQKTDDKIYSIMYASALRSIGEYAEALDVLDIALANYPDFTGSYLLMKAMVYERSRDYDKALAEVELALEKAPEATDRLLSEKTTILKRLGRNKELADVYDQIIERVPENPEENDYTIVSALIGKAAAQLRTGQPENAIETYDRLLEMDPESTGIMILKADVLDRTGNKSEARELYTRVLEIETDTVPKSFRPLALQGLGRSREALDFMHTLLDADSSYINLFYLACLYGRMADAANTVMTLRKISEMYPGEPDPEVIADELDFDAVRKDPAFEDFMTELDKQ